MPFCKANYSENEQSFKQQKNSNNNINNNSNSNHNINNKNKPSNNYNNYNNNNDNNDIKIWRLGIDFLSEPLKLQQKQDRQQLRQQDRKQRTKVKIENKIEIKLESKSSNLKWGRFSCNRFLDSVSGFRRKRFQHPLEFGNILKKEKKMKKIIFWFILYVLMRKLVFFYSLAISPKKKTFNVVA